LLEKWCTDGCRKTDVRELMYLTKDITFKSTEGNSGHQNCASNFLNCFEAFLCFMTGRISGMSKPVLPVHEGSLVYKHKQVYSSLFR